MKNKHDFSMLPMMIVTIMLMLNVLFAVQSHQRFDNRIFFNHINYEEKDFTRVRELPNWFFIFPGTKWCGRGNISSSYDDLGILADSDKCCRSHDHCEDVIIAGETKYNLTNDTPNSRLSCKCDNEFYDCLKCTDDMISAKIGMIYFTSLGTKCFKKEYPVTGCKEYSDILMRKCKVYNVDSTKPMIYQWFDVPDYKLF